MSTPPNPVGNLDTPLSTDEFRVSPSYKMALRREIRRGPESEEAVLNRLIRRFGSETAGEIFDQLFS